MDLGILPTAPLSRYDLMEKMVAQHTLRNDAQTTFLLNWEASFPLLLFGLTGWEKKLDKDAQIYLECRGLRQNCLAWKFTIRSLEQLMAISAFGQSLSLTLYHNGARRSDNFTTECEKN